MTLQENFPHIYRFALSIFPSEDDDVITSPYNALMTSRSLINSADCVFPVENQALMSFSHHSEEKSAKHPLRRSTAAALATGSGIYFLKVPMPYIELIWQTEQSPAFAYCKTHRNRAKDRPDDVYSLHYADVRNIVPTEVFMLLNSC